MVEENDQEVTEEVKLDFFTENVTDWYANFAPLQGYDKDWTPTMGLALSGQVSWKKPDLEAPANDQDGEGAETDELAAAMGEQSNFRSNPVRRGRGRGRGGVGAQGRGSGRLPRRNIRPSAAEQRLAQLRNDNPVDA